LYAGGKDEAMNLQIYLVDAFTNQPFKGNPAAVCILDAPVATAWMQELAREMNVAETAFLLQQVNGYGLRWFTPACEAELCGHATLASAHILWEAGYLWTYEEALFHTQSGLLRAHKVENQIKLSLPRLQIAPAEASPALLQGLGVSEPKFAGRFQSDYLLHLESATEVRNLRPDFAALQNLPVRGILVTAASDEMGYDFVVRFFAPGNGINEAPVTGAAHCSLGPYWATRLGKKQLVGHQCSTRGGTVRMQVDGEQMILAGEAVTVLRGEIVCRNIPVVSG
jgi:PhzF family phenazine biosynthesis protein